MAAPFTGVTIASYNANPPADDGSAVASNRVTWAGQKTKLTDPLKTAIESINTNLLTAFGKVVGGAGVTTTAISYAVGVSDQGKLVKVTGAGGITITTPDATAVNPFVFALLNNSTGSIVLDGSGTQTVDGALTITIPAGSGAFVFTDGTNWFTAGQNYTRGLPPQSSFKSLSIKVASNTTVTVASDYVTMYDSSGVGLTLAVSGTIDLGSNGAVNKLDAGTIAVNTWYAIWAIAKADGTQGCLASASFTAPTLPSGYTFKARIGAVQTINGSATLYGTWQFGKRAQYVVGLAQTAVTPVIASGSGGTYSATTPTLTSSSVARFVPTTASEIHLYVANSTAGSGAANILVAPSTAYGGTNNGPTGSNGMLYPVWDATGASQMKMASIILETTSIAWASSAAGLVIACNGWTDNI